MLALCSLTDRFQNTLYRVLFLSAAVFLSSVVLPASLLAADARIFSISPATPLTTIPSSLLIQSPSFFNVPAGSSLTVLLMRGNLMVARSELKFTEAYQNDRLFPAVPMIAFYPLGDTSGAGQPLPRSTATMTPGYVNMQEVAAAPGEYRLLWNLSDGVIGDPGRIVASGSAFLDMKLSSISAAIRPGDQKPGSVLFYNRYRSNSLNPILEDSSISLTNTNPTEKAFIRIFMVNNECTIADYGLCLNAGQTISILASDLDPDNRGYVMAVACNAAGVPIQFNWLTGGVVVKQPNPLNGLPFDVSFSAIAVAKRSPGALTPASGAAELIFDDSAYDRLPSQITADDVPSQNGTNNRTTIAVFRPLDDLNPSRTTSFDTIFRLNGKNNAGQTGGNETSTRNVCYFELRLWQQDTSPTRIRDLMPAGTTAWFTTQTSTDQAILGAQLNYGRFSAGSSSRALNYATEYRIKMPVKTITCVN